MQALSRGLIIVAIGLVTVLFASTAHAQATRTWVSGVGDDVNPCSRTAPCKTFAGAISKTATGGIINCLDPGGFGAVTITKSIEINCLNTKAGVLASGTNCIVINSSAAVVVLRGIDIEGIGFATSPGLVGVSIVAAATVHIEKCTIRGFRGGTANGVRVATTVGNPEVNILDSYITDNVTGVQATSTGFALVTIYNTRISNNDTGVANTATGRMRISNSLFSANSTGVQATAGAQVSIGTSDLVSHSVQAINGAWTTFGNNRFAGNTSDGTAGTAAGAASSDLGQK